MYPKRVSRVRISLSPQRYDSQPAAKAAGCFRHTADASSLVDDVWRKQTLGPSGPAAVNHIIARTPREGAEIAAAPGRRNLALPNISLSPSSRTSAPPMGKQNALSCAPRADIGLWRTATIDMAHKRPVPVRLFGQWGTVFALIETYCFTIFAIMKHILLCLLCFMSLSAYAQHTVVVNPDGTHSVAIQTGNTITVVNSDGTHSTAIQTGNILTVVHPNGTHATGILTGSSTTIVNPDGTHTTVIENGNDITIAKPKGRKTRQTLESRGKKKSSKKHDRKHRESD